MKRYAPPIVKLAIYNLTATVQAGGVETRCREMGQALAARGHTVHLFGGEAPNVPPLEGIARTFLYPFTPRDRFPNFGTRFRKAMERVSFGRRAVRDLAAGAYDAIYLVKPFDIPFALHARRKSGARVVFASGGTEFFPGYGPLIRRVDNLFACSRFNAAQIRHRTGREPVVLPNGVNVTRFAPRDPNPDVLAEIGVQPGEKVLFSACRLIGLKGLDFALRAAAMLEQRGLRVRFVLAGDGPARNELEELARDLGREDRTVFLGNRPNERLPDYYAAADVAVYPSVADETFGIAMGEALACGVPVVSTQVGGIPDVVIEGTGLLTQPADSSALTDALETLLTDDNRRAAMGRAGRKWIAGHRSWTAAAEKLEGFLQA